jgi:hypothetical protein
VWERGVEENILTKEGGSGGRLEKATYYEHHNLYTSPNVIMMMKSRRVKWAEHVASMGGIRKAYNTWVERPEGKRSLGRPRHRWEDNIRMILREIQWEGVDWLNLVQDRD